jgi:hypothetical protein
VERMRRNKRVGEGKERGEILSEDGRDKGWVEEIWKRRKRIEKERGWLIERKNVIFYQ